MKVPITIMDVQGNMTSIITVVYGATCVIIRANMYKRLLLNCHNKYWQPKAIAGMEGVDPVQVLGKPNIWHTNKRPVLLRAHQENQRWGSRGQVIMWHSWNISTPDENQCDPGSHGDPVLVMSQTQALHWGCPYIFEPMSSKSNKSHWWKCEKWFLFNFCVALVNCHNLKLFIMYVN